MPEANRAKIPRMNILADIMKFLPSILAGIIAVEDAVKTSGPNKKAIVMGAVSAAAKAGENIPSPTVQGISALIDNTVTVLNQAGVFTSSAVAGPPAA